MSNNHPKTPDFVDPAELIWPPEAAAMLGVKEDALTKWAHEKRGPRYTKVGRRRAYTRRWIGEYVAQQIHNPEAA
jgi:hypothetical protein